MAWPIERGVHGDLGSGSVDCARGLSGGGRLTAAAGEEWWCWPGSPLPTCGKKLDQLKITTPHYPVRAKVIRLQF